jgi:hypothetical protein
MATVPAVSAVHEHVNDWTQQQQDIRKGTQEVGAVLFPQEEPCDGQKHARTHPIRDSPSLLI